MSLNNQLVCISLCFFLSFASIRSFLLGLKRYLLCKTSYEKRKASETFIDKLTYKKWKKDFPLFYIILYYFIIVVHLFSLIGCILLEHFNVKSIGEYIAIGVFCFDLIWIGIHTIAYWSPTRKHFPYERWIHRKNTKKNNK